jgi:hypothetical protein
MLLGSELRKGKPKSLLGNTRLLLTNPFVCHFNPASPKLLIKEGVIYS